MDTLAIVQYLYSRGINVIPTTIIERNHPIWVTAFPSIETATGARYSGITECIAYYNQCMPQPDPDLLEKALQFKAQNPRYCIRS